MGNGPANWRIRSVVARGRLLDIIPDHSRLDTSVGGGWELRRDVLRRIAIECDDVRDHPSTQRARLALQSKRLRGGGCRCTEDVARRKSDFRNHDLAHEREEVPWVCSACVRSYQPSVVAAGTSFR